MRFLIVMIAGLMAMATPAFAQIGQNGGPISVDADKGEYLNGGLIVRWTGSVDVRQGENRLLADQIDIYLTEANSSSTGDIERIVAEGNFYYVTPEETVRGERGVYTFDTDTIVVTGDVRMSQGNDNVIAGERLTYRVSEGYAEINGTCQSRQCPRDERVRAIFRSENE